MRRSPSTPPPCLLTLRVPLAIQPPFKAHAAEAGPASAQGRKVLGLLGTSGVVHSRTPPHPLRMLKNRVHVMARERVRLREEPR